MKENKIEKEGSIGHFPYPGEWLDVESEEIAKSIEKWATTEGITKRLEFRENIEHQMSSLKTLAVDIGLHRLIWPEEIGGVGFGVPEVSSTLVRAYEEIGRADPGIGYISAMNMALGATLIADKKVDKDIKKEIGSIFCGTEDLKLFSLILPGLGNVDTAPRKTLSGREVQADIQQDGDVWVLNAKNARPINSGHNAYMYAVIAEAPDGFVLALVPGKDPGVKTGELLKTTGLLASRNADVDFKKVKVSASHVIPIDEVDYKRLITWIDLIAGAIAVGSTMDVYRLVKDWADNRVIKAGGLLKENPMDAAVLAQVAMDIISSRLLVHSLARAIAKPEGFGIKGADNLFVLAETVSIKVLDSCIHAINRAMELMGSAGYAKEWHVEKHWRDLKTLQVYLGGRTPVEMDVARAYYGSKTL